VVAAAAADGGGRVKAEGVFKCAHCKTPIAVGHIEAGDLMIKCKRCGEKTRVGPTSKAA
jgi:DNA-directed RNA polymerase subunit RPC12/RpoP